ncbi:NERD domain-containing protein [Atlantibacter subterranea]|uniref:3'-5' exonuclease n=1 Tax=Atlantibacter subterraneus TaxID=255519 RepID=UPI0020C4EA22|nr:3'-5' exonuclease [Atlantibacter subterranea]UTJ47994.1 NERD domain-containing protein [Atlantibacter subterranea]
MAIIIPTINSCSGKIMAGEKRLARLLENSLDERSFCWYDIPTGHSQLYPDFIVLSPQLGILFIEVKDWFANRIKRVNKNFIVYETQDEDEIHQNPLEQARKYSHATLDLLKKDPLLIQNKEKYKGNLCIPYGYGVYLSNITRRQYDKIFKDEVSRSILPPDAIICKDELTEFMNESHVAARLKRLMLHAFPFSMSEDQINRIRWLLYPEIRINYIENDSDEPQQQSFDLTMPDIVKIMDMQQELLARSLGEGHRVIHGVAGSGKTLILLYRCLHLAQINLRKPVLVICFNITLAKKLSALIKSHPKTDNVEITHFHSWCYQQVHNLNIPLEKGLKFPENYEKALATGFKDGLIPREQYSAVLIDEGHDFKSEWLEVLSQMVSNETNTLLFLYDDAQSIYQKRNALNFSLASVGIQAQGRTSVLKLNYRNTRQILHFASGIAFNYLNGHRSDNFRYDTPDAGGDSGPYPVIMKFMAPESEYTYVANWLIKEHKNGVAWQEMAILSPSTKLLPQSIRDILKSNDIPFTFIQNGDDKKKYNPYADTVSILPLPSSKGLEFHSVAVIDSCNVLSKDNDLSEDIKKLYVGFTRAKQKLLVTFNRDNELSKHLMTTYEKITSNNK